MIASGLPSWGTVERSDGAQYRSGQRPIGRASYASRMSFVNALWLATAIWLLALVSVAAVFGWSSWAAASTLFAGAVPLLIAHRLGSARGQTTSQDIQRELH